MNVRNSAPFEPSFHAPATLAPKTVLVSARDLKPGDLTEAGIIATVEEASFLSAPAIRYVTTEGRAFLAHPSGKHRHASLAPFWAADPRRGTVRRASLISLDQQKRG